MLVKDGFVKFHEGRGEWGLTPCRSGLVPDSLGIAIQTKTLVIVLKGTMLKTCLAAPEASLRILRSLFWGDSERGMSLRDGTSRLV